MTEVRRLEELLHRLHQDRVNCEKEILFTADKLESLWTRIRRYEGELEERRLELGIVRNSH